MAFEIRKQGFDHTSILKVAARTSFEPVSGTYLLK